MNLPDLFTTWLAHRARMAELGPIAWSTHGNQSDSGAGPSPVTNGVGRPSR